MNAHETLARQFFDTYKQHVTSMSDGEAFDRYLAHLIVQKPPFELPDDAIDDGITEGGSDGGVDAVYVIFNGEAVEGDNEILLGAMPPSVRQGFGRLDIVVLQAKTSGFGTTAAEKLIANLPRLLDISIEIESLNGEFNALVIERFTLARSVWKALAGTGVSLHIHVYMGSLASIEPISHETQAKIDELKNALNQKLPGISGVDVSIIDAPKIILRQRLTLPEDFELPYQKSLTSESGYIALVRISDYATFVTDGNGRVRAALLDENVRDFQGGVEVNKGIKESLEEVEGPPFWWLNNGVTVICQEVSLVGEEFRLRNPRIVNGLQTTRVVHDYFLSQAADNHLSKQLLQVRILSTEAPAERDAVIRATNSQTAVEAASLRATDEVQRRIEAFFRVAGLYYDRRKGSYRDSTSIDSQSVISIRELGQVLTAVILGRPDEARGKPSSLLKDDQRYLSIFDLNVPLEIYEFMARVNALVVSTLSSENAPLTSVERKYLRFHVISAIIADKLGFWSTGYKRLATLAKSGWLPEEHEIVRVASVVVNELNQHLVDSATTIEKATKAQGFTSRLATLSWSSDSEDPQEEHS